MFNLYTITSQLTSYYKQILFLILLCGVGLGSYIFFQSEKLKSSRASADVYFTSILEHNPETQSSEITDGLKTILHDKNNFAALASLITAQNLVANKSLSAASTMFLAISQNDKFDVVLRDYAFLLYAQTLLALKDYEKFKSIIDQLNKNNFRNNATELIAVYYIASGNNAEAQTLIDSVLNVGEFDKNLEKSLLERFKQLDFYLANNKDTPTNAVNTNAAN